MNGRRIFVNTLATYGRSVVGALLGLFTARWVLGALGSSDFGLYGVVGGVVFVFSFLTPVLSSSIGRFYAFSMERPAELRQWFNTAVVLMAFLSVSLVLVAYPVCLYALEHWLVIPDGRLGAAIWVLRFSLLTASVSMVSAPYLMMFSAKQDIVEAATWQLIQSVLVFFFAISLSFMHVRAGCAGADWLVVYAGVMAGITVILAVVQIGRVRRKYAECALGGSLMCIRDHIRPLLVFVGWQLLGGFAWTIRSQGLVFLVNVLFGPSFNASYTISNQVSNQAAALSVSVGNAIAPALTTEEGVGRRASMLQLARFGTFLGVVLVMLFAVPIAVFINPILKLWLGTPPPGCATLCVAMLAVAVIRQFAGGSGMAILAHGKLGPWQVCDAVANVLALPVAYVCWKSGCGIASVGWAWVVSESVMSINKIVFARKLRVER